MFVVPYKLGSRSAKKLAENLRMRRSRGVKIFRPLTKVVNWGKSDFRPRGRGLTVINKPEAVALAANKISSLTRMRANGVSTIDFTTNRSDAMAWIDEGYIVYGRQLLNAHSGRGIVILSDESLSVPQLPLYTKGVLKAHEYRVHVAFGQVIDVSKKRRRATGEANPLIKNLSNGWVFCREGLNLPDKVRNEALKAVAALGLDFGAVDVVYRERENVAFILEVNTAPGLEGTTLEKYTEAIGRKLYAC